MSGFQFTAKLVLQSKCVYRIGFCFIDRAMVHGDSADLLKVTTTVLSNEPVEGDAIDLQSAALLNAVGIDKLHVEVSRLISGIAIKPQNNFFE